MCQGKFLYILEPCDFNQYFKKGILKYIPNNILIMFSKSIKPRIVCNFINADNDNVQGYGVGLFITYKNLKKPEYLSHLIDAVNKIKTEDTKNIIIESIHTLNQDDIAEIENKSGLKVSNGREQIIANILYVLEEIFNLRNQKLGEKEILIISDDTELTERVVSDIAKKTRFLSIVSKDHMFSEKITNDILFNTGLSLQLIKKLEKSINKFDIIVNLDSKLLIDIYKIKRRAIIIDISIGRILEGLMKNNRTDILVISDLLYKKMQSLKCNPEISIFEKEVPSYIYEAIIYDKRNIPVGIRANEKSYTIKEAVDKYLGYKQNKSIFQVK